MSLATRWRRWFGGLFHSAPLDGSKTTTAQIAQVVVEPYVMVQGNLNIGQVLVEDQVGVVGNVKIAQTFPEPLYQVDTTNVKTGQVIVEVLRTAHCVMIPPVMPPQPVCPPVDLTGVAAEGCVAVTDFTGTALGGCAAAVDPL